MKAKTNGTNASDTTELCANYLRRGGCKRIIGKWRWEAKRHPEPKLAFCSRECLEDYLRSEEALEKCIRDNLI